jgi:hypothetical protein
MTEHGGLDRDERIRLLEERSSPGGRAAKARRRRPATASRILLVGLSVASFFTVITGFGLRQNSASTAVAPAPPAATPTIATPATPAPISATPAQTSIAPAPSPAPAQSTTRGS